MNRKQRRAAQSQGRGDAMSGPPLSNSAVAAQLSAEGMRHHHAGRLAEACDLYRQSLAIEPRQTASMENLAVIAYAAGRTEEARSAFERVLAIDPKLASAHHNLGRLHQVQGRFDQAIDCYLRAIELKPDQFDTHNNLCIILMLQGQFTAVVSHYEQILALKPDYVIGHINLARAHLGAGNALRALDAIRRAMRISAPREGRALFVQCLKAAGTASATDDIRDLVFRAMSEPWGRPSDLAGACLSLIRTNDEMARSIDRAAAAWPARLTAEQLFAPSGLRALAREPLLRCLLENTRNHDIATERWLTSARLALLDAASKIGANDEIDADEIAFYCALARQCFINEYVFAETEPESARVNALRTLLATALHSNAPVPTLWPVAVAAYGPLHALGDGESLLDRAWPKPVDALLTQQLREPAEERKLRGSIPTLTPIEDSVSVLVQNQYEENPYPRWVKAAPCGGPMTIDAILRQQFPFATFRELGRTGAVDVLVAGCGTGQQLLDVAPRIVDARVLAIDLSRTSLAYAKRQTDALGLANIDYGQADILQLGGLGRSFDVIDCGGVLHHLGDPIAGWHVLLSLLRPDGVMRIALYSELARQHFVAARARIAECGYGHSADEIRRFRQLVLELPDGDQVKTIARNLDFFSVSSCRDLVFHVQEHRFTLPQIHAFLAANELEFLGFEIDLQILSQYTGRFPEDRARTDLARWHAFEQANPSSFGTMYQFWVQKRASA